MNIKKAHIIVVDDDSDDVVVLTTDLPTPYKDGTVDNLHLRFECSNKTGAEYVRNHFDIEPEIIYLT